MRAVVCLVALLISAIVTEAKADGAFAVGRRSDGRRVFVIEANRPSDVVDSSAQQTCALRDGQNCRLTRHFADGCVGFAYDQDHFEFYEGDTPSAGEAALMRCNDQYRDCRPGFTLCDDHGPAAVQVAIEDRPVQATISPPVPPADERPAPDAARTDLTTYAALILPGALLVVILAGLFARQFRTAQRRSDVEPTLAFSEPPPLPRSPAAAPETSEPSRALIVVPDAPAAPSPLDTPAALRALRLAYSYLDETSDQNFADPDEARAARTTLALAGRQLDVAHCADPNAKLESDDGILISQARLRARILHQEALTWAPENLSKAAVIAERATKADATYAAVFDTLGMFHFHNRNRDAAITALTRALDLDPDNIETLKLLDRAQNMGVAEIATFKATKAGMHVAGAGIKVYNAGVHTRNFFAIIWNIFATFWNIISFPVRLMERIVGIIFGGGR